MPFGRYELRAITGIYEHHEERNSSGHLRKLMIKFRKIEETDKVSVKSRMERHEELQDNCRPRTR